MQATRLRGVLKYAVFAAPGLEPVEGQRLEAELAAAKAERLTEFVQERQRQTAAASLLQQRLLPLLRRRRKVGAYLLLQLPAPGGTASCTPLLHLFECRSRCLRCAHLRVAIVFGCHLGCELLDG